MRTIGWLIILVSLFVLVSVASQKSVKERSVKEGFEEIDSDFINKSKEDIKKLLAQTPDQNVSAPLHLINGAIVKHKDNPGPGDINSVVFGSDDPYRMNESGKMYIDKDSLNIVGYSISKDTPYKTVVSDNAFTNTAKANSYTVKGAGTVTVGKDKQVNFELDKSKKGVSIDNGINIATNLTAGGSGSANKVCVNDSCFDPSTVNKLSGLQQDIINLGKSIVTTNSGNVEAARTSLQSSAGDDYITSLVSNEMNSFVSSIKAFDEKEILNQLWNNNRNEKEYVFDDVKLSRNDTTGSVSIGNPSRTEKATLKMSDKNEELSISYDKDGYLNFNAPINLKSVGDQQASFCFKDQANEYCFKDVTDFEQQDTVENKTILSTSDQSTNLLRTVNQSFVVKKADSAKFFDQWSKPTTQQSTIRIPVNIDADGIYEVTVISLWAMNSFPTLYLEADPNKAFNVVSTSDRATRDGNTTKQSKFIVEELKSASYHGIVRYTIYNFANKAPKILFDFGTQDSSNFGYINVLKTGRIKWVGDVTMNSQHIMAIVRKIM